MATGGYKENRSSTGSIRESELLILPFGSQRQHNFERGKEQCFHHISEEVKEGRLRKRYKLLTIPETSEETIPESQAEENCECLWKKMIGKPYSGKPNVRIDVAGDGEVLQVISVVTRHSLTLLNWNFLMMWPRMRSIVNYTSQKGLK